MNIKIRKMIYLFPQIYNLCKRIVQFNNDFYYRHLTKNTNNEENIRRIHNIALGKRCFIIGNGPSLCVEDLEAIKGIDSFASNYITQIYEKTEWRPTYYCVFDRYVDINSDILSKEILFSGPYFLRKHKLNRQCNCLNLQMSTGNPKFSEDVSKIIYDGGSVTYSIFQIATYMGYKEIILLGMDHNYSFLIDDNGNLTGSSSSNEHFYGIKDKNNANATNVKKIDRAYKVAKEYCDIHGIKVLNATRGGRLDLFNRVCLEDVLDDKI